MTEALRGLEILTKQTIQFATPLIQPGENILACIRATGGDQDRAYIALDSRLLFVIPIRNKWHSIEYIDLQTVEITEDSFLGLGRVIVLEIRTTYGGDTGWYGLDINPKHRQYTMQFAEFLRAKAREARAPSPKVEKQDKSSSTFIDELERLDALHEKGGLTDEEYELAKRKLLS
jgi:hypothetical protein